MSKNRPKLKITFHNPNTEEATIEFLTTWYAKILVDRVIKEQKELIEKELASQGEETDRKQEG